HRSAQRFLDFRDDEMVETGRLVAVEPREVVVQRALRVAAEGQLLADVAGDRRWPEATVVPGRQQPFPNNPLPFRPRDRRDLSPPIQGPTAALRPIRLGSSSPARTAPPCCRLA